jgi:callose synthase
MCVVLINLVQILCGELLYTDEWKNFLTRINRDENAAESELFSSANDILELRLWASYRGQTLARTGLL